MSDLPGRTQGLPSEPRKLLLRAFKDAQESNRSQNVRILETRLLEGSRVRGEMVFMSPSSLIGSSQGK